MAKITLATVKKFVRENLDNETLFIKKKSAFDGMTDGVEYNTKATFEKAEKLESTEQNEKYKLRVAGAWFVGSSRDYFNQYEDDHFKGIEVYNCCGSFILAIKKSSAEPTHKVIYDPTQKAGFEGAFLKGTFEECKAYCEANNGQTGHYFTYITVEI